MPFLLKKDRELWIKQLKVDYFFSKLSSEEKIECLLKSDFCYGIENFFEFYLEELSGNLLKIYEDETFSNVKRAWKRLSDDEQLKLVIKIICNNDLEKYIEENIDFFMEYFGKEIGKIHWVFDPKLGCLPREDVVNELKAMLKSQDNDPKREMLIKYYNIDENFDWNKFSDEELAAIHYILSGIIY